MITSMSVVAFASSNEKTLNEVGQKVQVYNTKTKETVEIDTSELEISESVKSDVLKGAKGEAVKVIKALRAPGEKVEVYDMKKGEIVDINTIDLEKLQKIQSVKAVKVK